MKRFLIFIGLISPLFAGDANFSGNASNRHAEMKDNMQSQDFWERKYLTGDWGDGGRSKLARDGVTIGMSYVADILGNPYGGRARGVAFAGSFGLDVNIDFSKFSNLKGFSLYFSSIGRTGTNLSADKIGNQFPVAQVYGGQNIRFNELYLKQIFFEERLIIKAGRLDAGNDFLQSELYYKFVNNGFNGNPIAVFFNGPFTAYPNSTWSLYFQFRPFKRVLGKVATYLANKDVSKNKYHGFNWSLNSTDGWQLISEWAYEVNQLKEDTGYPGNYRVGGFYYTKSHGEKYLGGHYHGNYGWYILLDQMIYRPQTSEDKKRGLTPFIALLFAPKDRNLLPFFISSGLVYKGLFKQRPEDFTNLGFIYGKYSTDMNKAQEMARKMKLTPVPSFGNQPQNFEALFELNHWFQITPAIVVVPDIQYIFHPKGIDSNKNALVIGAQIGVTF